MFRYVCGLAVVALCLSLGGCSNEPSETANGMGSVRSIAFERAPLPPKAPSQRSSEETHAASSIIRIVSGEEDSAYSRTIADLTAILDSDRLRFQAIASQGPQQDLLNLLNRPDTDVAIIPTDAIQALPERIRAAARQRLRYLFLIPNKELHVLAPRGISEIQQLNGRKVNIDRPGSSTNLTARLIFGKLGIEPEFTTDDQTTAHRHLRSGEIQAALVLASRPSSEVLAFPSEGQFHLLPIPFEDTVIGYSPSRFTFDDYPHLVVAGRPVETVAVGRVLAVRNWAEGSPRHGRLARLAEAISSRFDELQQSGRNPRWKEVSRLAGAPGWQRFKPVQDLLDRSVRQFDEQRAFERLAAASGICALPASTAAYERLYNDFVEWRRARDDGVHPRSYGPDPK
jgi:uncharacterized protein